MLGRHLAEQQRLPVDDQRGSTTTRDRKARVAAGFEVQLAKGTFPLGELCLLSAASPQSLPPMWLGIHA
jgi:hypothetical protein